MHWIYVFLALHFDFMRIGQNAAWYDSNQSQFWNNDKQYFPEKETEYFNSMG